MLPLPVIKNSKTVDPRDKKSTKVLQLETAMGAAIVSFEGAGAILIPRTRFAPVKTTSVPPSRGPELGLRLSTAGGLKNVKFCTLFV